MVARPPILRGAKPADIPVEQPTKFDLIINLTAARAARSRDPAHPLARPDEVISRRSGLLRCLSPVGTNLPIRNVRYMAAGIAAACSAACQIEFRLIHIYRDDEMALGMGVVAYQKFAGA